MTGRHILLSNTVNIANGLFDVNVVPLVSRCQRLDPLP